MRATHLGNLIGEITDGAAAAKGLGDEGVVFRRSGIEQVHIPTVTPGVGRLVAESDRPFAFIEVAQFLAFGMTLMRPGDAMLDRHAVPPPHPSDGDGDHEELEFVRENRLVAVDEVCAVAKLDDAALGKSLGFWRDAGPAVAMWNHQLAAAVSHVTSPLVFARAGP